MISLESAYARRMDMRDRGGGDRTEAQAALRERLGKLVEQGKLTREEAGEPYRAAFPESAPGRQRTQRPREGPEREQSDRGSMRSPRKDFARAEAGEPSGKAIKLFNGKDLSGWEFWASEPARMEDVWSVADGLVVSTGSPRGYIYTKALYENFKLVVEYRWPLLPDGASPPTAARGRGQDRGRGRSPASYRRNSGILMRLTGEHSIFPDSLEAQLAPGDVGAMFGFQKFNIDNERAVETRHPGVRVSKTREAENPIGQWNRFDITVYGDRATYVLNGVTVNEATGCDVRPGSIALQMEGGVLQFRTVTLVPLGDAPALAAGRSSREDARPRPDVRRGATAERRGRGNEYEALALRMRAAVAEGKMTPEQAPERLEAYRKSLGQSGRGEQRPVNENAKTEAYLKVIEGRLKEAVEAGDLSESEAKARFEAIRKEEYEKAKGGQQRERRRRRSVIVLLSCSAIGTSTMSSFAPVNSSQAGRSRYIGPDMPPFGPLLSTVMAMRFPAKGFFPSPKMAPSSSLLRWITSPSSNVTRSTPPSSRHLRCRYPTSPWGRCFRVRKTASATIAMTMANKATTFLVPIKLSFMIWPAAGYEARRGIHYDP